MKSWLSSYIRVPYPFRRAPFSPSTLIWSKIFDFCKRPHDRCDQLCWCRRQSLNVVAMKVDFQASSTKVGVSLRRQSLESFRQDNFQLKAEV
jgi:hypothetical protein